VDLLERFLEYHTQKRSADATYRFYQHALSSFGRFVGNLRVSHLKPYHIDDWIAQEHQTIKRAKPNGQDENGKTKYIVTDTGKPTSDNYRRNLIRAVKAAFRWAQRKEHIDRNPIQYVELPS